MVLSTNVAGKIPMSFLVKSCHAIGPCKSLCGTFLTSDQYVLKAPSNHIKMIMPQGTNYER